MDMTEIVKVLLTFNLVIALSLMVYVLYLTYNYRIFIEKRKNTMKLNEDHLKYHINRLYVMNKSLHDDVPEMFEKLKEISKYK